MDDRKEATKLLLRLATSILLTSVRANVPPYHEIVAVGQSAPPFFVAPVYGVAPAVTLLPPEPVEQTKTIVAGPVTRTTIVKGSSSGPVTIVSPGTSSNGVSSIGETRAPNAPSATEDSVLVRGASSGPVTLVAPSDNSVATGDADNAESARTETKEGVVATSAKASVAIENAEESSTTEASANTTAIRETIGIVSANAVIGPSTGPIVIAGPTAPPLPIALATSTSSSGTISLSTTASSVEAASGTTANAIDTITDETTRIAETTESTKIEGSSSNTSTVTTTRRNTVAPATAEINLIPAKAVIPVTGTASSNIVVSAATGPSVLVSGPTGSSASLPLFESPLYSLQR
ncbi:uncharacterized protein LOC100878431 [Megachile rotundata]|uniref:uncharacterized protein LOC100878431 n=1 Tax=Megachile rotundata TaxID=143995 RepID=UPI003FCEEE29